MKTIRNDLLAALAAELPELRARFLDELLSRAEPIPFAGCYVWLGWTTGKGHANVSMNGRTVKVSIRGYVIVGHDEAADEIWSLLQSAAVPASPAEIEEIEKRHEAAERQRRAAWNNAPITEAIQEHQDRATLLAYIKSAASPRVTT